MRSVRRYDLVLPDNLHNRPLNLGCVRMTKENLREWFTRALLVIALTTLATLLNRWLGVRVEIPPIPVTVTVDDTTGAVKSTTVHQVYTK